MHAAAREFLQEHSSLPGHIYGKAIDFGGRYVNGDVHDLWPKHEWTVVDNHPNPVPTVSENRVSEYRYIKANAARWSPDIIADLVICTEVFEHTKEWPDICKTAYFALDYGGIFLVTAGGHGRHPHSMHDGGPLRHGEHYENVSAHHLGSILTASGFRSKTIYNPHEKDVYAVAVKQQ